MEIQQKFKMQTHASQKYMAMNTLRVAETQTVPGPAKLKCPARHGGGSP